MHVIVLTDAPGRRSVVMLLSDLSWPLLQGPDKRPISEAFETVLLHAASLSILPPTDLYAGVRDALQLLNGRIAPGAVLVFYDLVRSSRCCTCSVHGIWHVLTTSESAPLIASPAAQVHYPLYRCAAPQNLCADLLSLLEETGGNVGTEMELRSCNAPSVDEYPHTCAMALALQAVPPPCSAFVASTLAVELPVH